MWLHLLSLLPVPREGWIFPSWNGDNLQILLMGFLKDAWESVTTTVMTLQEAEPHRVSGSSILCLLSSPVLSQIEFRLSFPFLNSLNFCLLSLHISLRLLQFAFSLSHPSLLPSLPPSFFPSPLLLPSSSSVSPFPLTSPTPPTAQPLMPLNVYLTCW